MKKEKLKRRVIYMQDAQWRLTKKIAAKKGITASELIRRVLYSLGSNPHEIKFKGQKVKF